VTSAAKESIQASTDTLRSGTYASSPDGGLNRSNTH